MKTFTTFLFACALSLTQAHAVSSDLELRDADIGMVDFINVRDLSSDLLQEIVMGDHPNLAVQFSAGDELPFHLVVDGTLITLVKSEETQLQVRFNQDIYVKSEQGRLAFSTDLKQWRPFHAFIKGEIKGGMHIHEQAGPMILFGVEVSERGHPEPHPLPLPHSHQP